MKNYELVDESGKIVGYYEPYSESNPAPNKEIMPLYTSRINWTIGANQYGYGDNRYTIGKGDTMTIDISQSVSGKSVLRFENHTAGKGLIFLSTETTDGWYGTIVFGDIETAVYSFGILNQSESTITYTGNYSL